METGMDAVQCFYDRHQGKLRNDTICTQRERFMLNQVDPGLKYGLKEIIKDEVNLSWFRIHREKVTK